jgi:nitrous oxidase accessory protein
MNASDAHPARRRFFSASWSGTVLAFYAAALLLIAMALPWWRMDSRAPQYGQRVLVVDVSPTGVRGDIQELDGLGHYIGMRTLDTFAPIERMLAPYAVLAVALAALALPFVRSRRLRLALAVPVVAVPMGFVLDLWAWQQYAVTHLDPTAALNMIANRVQARVLGEYAVAQFHVNAYFQAGFWLVVVAAANVLGFLVAEWPNSIGASSEAPQPKNASVTVVASAATLLLAFLCPSAARATTLEVGAGSRYRVIADAVQAAAAGDEIVVHPGVYREHLTIDRALVVRADGEAILEGGGEGTVVRVTAGPTIIRGFAFRGSGESLLGEDAAIRVQGAAGSVIDQNRIADTLFGILVIQSPDSHVTRNRVAGKELIVPRRGDGIRVFASDGVLVADNIVEQSRDLAIWNSNRVDARRNVVRTSRYGLHFMYSNDDVFEDNVFEHNQVGGAVMYGRGLTLRRNRFEGSRGPSAHGLLIKAADGLVVEDNRFVDNTRGIYLSDVFSGCTVRGNLIGGNEAGISLEAAVRHVVFTDNALIANQVQVEVLGTRLEDLNAWSLHGRGNYWSDYVGFDADGDGIGDVPHTQEQFFEALADRWPALGLLRLGPASQALELAARAFPVVMPNPALVDEHPLLRAPASVVSVQPGDGNASLTLAGMAAVAAASWCLARARRGISTVSR